MSLIERIAARPNAVFFYPAGLYDWEPLRLFSEWCDTFVYCDVAINDEYFIQGLEGMRQIPDVTPVGNPRALKVDDDLAWGTDHHLATSEWLGRCLTRCLTPQFEAESRAALEIVERHGGPWGREICCRSRDRDLTVVCLRAEAFRCYSALFSRHNVAPRVVCLKPAYAPRHGFATTPWSPGHILKNPGEQRRLLSMDEWYAPLGRAVADSP